MAYYPKSQIKTNLYSSGEYVLSTTKEQYTGYYYELSNGDKFTGKTPQDGLNILLQLDPSTVIIDGEAIVVSPDLTTNVEFLVPFSGDSNYPLPEGPARRSLPSPSQPFPTQKDYDLGEFQRYFAKKRNENIYLEIDKVTHELLSNRDPQIAWDLYTSTNLSWDLSGERDQTFITNKNTVELVEKRNRFYGFTLWFKDNFLQYYKNPSIQEDLFTDGTEFVNRKTKLTYRGPYHIHPEKGPMVGAKHVSYPHDYLDPIQQTPDTTITSTSTPTYLGGGGSTSTGGGSTSGGGGGY